MEHALDLHQQLVARDREIERLRAQLAIREQRITRLLGMIRSQREQLQAGETQWKDSSLGEAASRRDADTYRGRWQRVLAAYLALREVGTLTVREAEELEQQAAQRGNRLPRAQRGQSHAQAYARLVLAEESLVPNDLKVIR